MKAFFEKTILLLLGIFAGLIIGEALMHILWSPQHYYYTHPPNTSFSFSGNMAHLPGINGLNHCSINAQGLRGDLLTQQQTYNILAIGGSTTECLFMDDTETWPALVQKICNDTIKEKKIWVGNAGKSGLNSGHHLLHLKHLPPQLGKIDAAIILVGINDFLRTLNHDSSYVPVWKTDLYANGFYNAPESTIFYKKTRWWALLRKLKRKLYTHPGYIQDSFGEAVANWRKNRQSTSGYIDKLPDLSQSLHDYKKNLEAIVNLCNTQNIRLMLMPNPAIWKEDMCEEEKALLWMGGIGDFMIEGGHRYYTPEVLDEGLTVFNDVLRKICKEKKIELIDLEKYLPKDTSVFYDDCHFNESGAEKVAHIVATHLLQHQNLISTWPKKINNSKQAKR